MRYPRVHRFLKWFGPSCIGICLSILGIIAAFSQSHPRLAKWSDAEFDYWWPVVSAPTFLASLAVVVAAYIGAIVYTGMPASSRGWNRRSIEGLSRVFGGLSQGQTERSFDDFFPPRARTNSLPAALSDAFRRGANLPPPRDTTLPDAFAWAHFGRWDKSYTDALLAGGTSHGDLAEQFRQKASEGLLTVWGKHNASGLFEQIPPEHWRDHHLRLSDMVSPTLEGGAEPYREIMLNRREVEKEWPHEG